MNKTDTLTLFLLPGLMCDKTVWQHQYENLSDVANIVIPDFRGHDSLITMAESVLAQAPPRFAVAGHSMGGRVALEVFRLAADKIDRLALLETGAHPLEEGERKIRESYIELAQAGGMDAVIDAWLFPMVHPDRRNDDSLLKDIKSMIKRTSVEDFVKQIRALVNRPDATPLLENIKCRTLLLAGRYDSLYTVTQHENMLSKIPHASFIIVEDAGHMATMERPEAVTNALRGWLLD